MKRTHPKFPTHLVLALAAASALAGCGVRNAGDPFNGPQDGRIRIVAINNDFNDATLTAVSYGERRRLGVLTGKSEATYTIPWAISGPLQIEISLLAAGFCTTPELYVDPGELLELQILHHTARGGRCSAPRAPEGER
jgi:hypothetical protein